MRGDVVLEFDDWRLLWQDDLANDLCVRSIQFGGFWFDFNLSAHSAICDDMYFSARYKGPVSPGDLVDHCIGMLEVEVAVSVLFRGPGNLYEEYCSKTEVTRLVESPADLGVVFLPIENVDQHVARALKVVVGIALREFEPLQPTDPMLPWVPDITISSGRSPCSSRMNLASALGDGTFADVEFEVCGVVFPAHRVILAARSEVFRSMLHPDSGFRTTDGEGGLRRESIADTTPDAFRALLEYMYVGKVPELKAAANSEEQRAKKRKIGNLLVDLIVLADKYQVVGLVEQLEADLVLGLDIANAAGFLKIAEKHSFEELKSCCAKFITSSAAIYHQVSNTPDYLTYVFQLIVSIIQKRILNRFRI